MSTTEGNIDAEQLNQTIKSALEGHGKTTENANRIFRGLTEAYGLPVVQIEEGGRKGSPLSRIKQRARDDEDFVLDRYGTKSPFLTAAAAGPQYKAGAGGGKSVKALDDMVEKAAIDESVVGAASPVEVDPRIVDIQRSRAPVLDRIMSQAQAGFTAQYNVISGRNDPIGMVSESEAIDLSSLSEGDFSLTTSTKDMKIYVDQVNISDFSQRAEQSLGYMDLTETTLGQRTIAHALFKAKQIFYGDPSVAAADKSVEDGDAYEGLAKIATDSGNDMAKSTVSSNFLEDLKSELTTQVENTGLTYDTAEFFVSPTMFDALENEANTVVRLDSYDENLQFGGRQIQIKGVPVTECPNIRNYAGLSGTNFTSDEGDVFLVDTSAVQFRQLAPLSTVPLGRVGLADKAAMFEYGTLVDKSQGEHLLYLESYDV